MRYILMEVTVQNAGTVPLTTQASDLHALHTCTASLHLHGLYTCTASLLCLPFPGAAAVPTLTPHQGSQEGCPQIAPPAWHLEGRKTIAVQVKGDTAEA